MELKDFYARLLPAAGAFAIFHVPTRKHAWADSLDELVAKTDASSRFHSWYFATAAFRERGSRTQANVLAKRCLYVDIDCGPEKHERDPDGTYPSLADGLKAFLEFEAATGLRASVLVGSGAGLHAYWALDGDIDGAAWLPLAQSLGALAAAKGLKVDTSCTTDSARVLRPQGALHKNGKRVKVMRADGPTWSLADLRARLPEAETFAPAPTSRAKLDVNGMLGSTFESQPVSALKVAEKCPALNHVAASRGDVPEPEWRAMIGVVKFCVEGADLAHEWSRGYDGYDEAETQAKYDAYAGTGPTVCATFERMNPKACASCEYRGKITTPCQLGRLTEKQVEALPPEQKPAPAPTADLTRSPFAGVDAGPNFRINQAGTAHWVLEGKQLVKSDVEGEPPLVVWTRFSDTVFWIEGWSESGEREGDDANVTVCVYHFGRVRRHQMPGGVMSGQADLLRWLGNKGVHTAGSDAKIKNLMSAYVSAQINGAKTVKPMKVVRDRFGLQFDGSEAGSELVCVQGSYLLRRDGSIEHVVVGGQLTDRRGVFDIAGMPESSTGRWSPEVWNTRIVPGARQQAEFYRKYYRGTGRDQMQLALMLSLGSPLLVFTADEHLAPGRELPALGLTVSLYSSGSGKGKTSLQEAAAAAYGNPSELVPRGGKNGGTANARGKIFGTLGTMPAFLDEVTSLGPSEVAEMVDRIASGRDKDRLSRSAALRHTGSWAFTALVSTNIPQRDVIGQVQRSSDALLMRLLELTCEFKDIEGGAHVEFGRDRDQLLFPNYGCLGACINYAIVRAGAESTRAMVQQRFQEATRLVEGSTQRERFLQRGMATALACHDLLTALGIEIFDRQTLVETYAEAARVAVDLSIRANRSPVEMFQKMISDLAPNIIVTQDLKRQGEDRVLNERHLSQPIVGRRVLNSRTLWLSKDAVGAWAAQNQFSASEMIGAAVKMRAVRMKGNALMRRAAQSRVLTSGTYGFSEVRAYCYEIDEAILHGEIPGATGADNVIQLNTENRNADDQDGGEAAA